MMDSEEQKMRLLGPDDSSKHDGSTDLERDDSSIVEEKEKQSGTSSALTRRDRLFFLLAFLVTLTFGMLGCLLVSTRMESHGGSSVTPAADSPRTIRAMIAGDSITHGFDGAHTWRYRLWQWLHENNVQATFVGPFNGTTPAPPDDQPMVVRMNGPVTRSVERRDDGPRTDGGYAVDVHPEFLETGHAHFSLWGQQAFQDIPLISQQVRDYRPDYLLIELGFNDLAWTARGADEVLESMKQLVDNARSANPSLRFAIANVPQRTKLGGGNLIEKTREYNEKLPEALSRWSSPDSPIELVKFREAYSCGQEGCPAGFDGLHPGIQGEFEIAYAFSETLHEKYGFGQQAPSVLSEYPRPICSTPVNVGEQAGSSGNKFVWDKVYGAYGYDVQIRKAGAEWPTDYVNFTQARHMDTPWTSEGGWEYRVRSYCETSLKSPWVEVVLSTGT